MEQHSLLEGATDRGVKFIVLAWPYCLCDSEHPLHKSSNISLVWPAQILS